MTKETTKKKLETVANNKYARKKKVENLPMIKIGEGQTVFFKINGPAIAKTMKNKPAVFLPVIDLNTGEVGQTLAGAILLRQLDENYPNQSYVGKSFEITKGEKVQGKSNEYFEFEIYELDA